jgi:hypothetical protein
MTDPLDSLRRTDDTLAPDPRFRVELLDRVANALVAESTRSVAVGEAPHDPKEIPMLKQLPANRTSSYVKIGLGLVAAAAVLVVGLVFIGDDDNDTPAPPANTAESTPSPLEEEIANAALLSGAELGDGYAIGAGSGFTLVRDGGYGTSAPACEPFLDGVFESADRPATVRTRGFANAGAGMQQYVAVFPDEATAVEMMDLVDAPNFAECWAVVVHEAYSAMAPGVTWEPFVPVEPTQLPTVGDNMVVVEVSSTFEYEGDTFQDRGPTVFLRVGRVVTFINPNTAETLSHGPGYPVELLERALQTIADRLEEIQAS